MKPTCKCQMARGEVKTSENRAAIATRLTEVTENANVAARCLIEDYSQSSCLKLKLKPLPYASSRCDSAGGNQMPQLKCFSIYNQLKCEASVC